MLHGEHPFVTKLLTSWDPALIYPHCLPSPRCNWFCKVHHSLQLKSSTTLWCCHFLCFQSVVVYGIFKSSHILLHGFLFPETEILVASWSVNFLFFVLKQYLPSYCSHWLTSCISIRLVYVAMDIFVSSSPKVFLQRPFPCLRNNFFFFCEPTHFSKGGKHILPVTLS